MGEADFQGYMLEGIQQAGLLNLVLMLFLILALRFLYGTWKSGLIFTAILAVCGTIVFGTMALLGAPLDVLTNTLFQMLVVAGLEDFVFLCNQQLLEGTLWKRSFRTLIVPGFFTSVTTFVGFASLAMTDVHVIARFGLWAALGSAVEWAVIFLVFPATVQVFPSLGVWNDPAREKASRWFSKLGRAGFPRRASLACLLVFVAAAFSVFHLRIADSPPRIFPADHPLNQGISYMKESRGWEAGVHVVFEDFEETARNRAVIEALRHHPAVVAVNSPYDVLDAMKAGHPPLTRELIEREIRPTDFFRTQVSGSGKAKVSFYLRDTELETVNAIRTEVGRLCPAHECSAAGSLVAYAEFAELIPRTLLGASRRGGLGQGIELRGAASIQCSLLMAAATLIFLGSYFAHPRVFGLLLSAGLIASLVGDVWILKGLIRDRQ